MAQLIDAVDQALPQLVEQPQLDEQPVVLDALEETEATLAQTAANSPSPEVVYATGTTGLAAAVGGGGGSSRSATVAASSTALAAQRPAAARMPAAASSSSATVAATSSMSSASGAGVTPVSGART